MVIALPPWFMVPALVLGGVGLIAVAWLYAKSTIMQTNFEVITKANGELRQEHQHLRDQIAERDVKIAGLEGKLEAYTNDLAKQLVSAFVSTIRELGLTIVPKQGGDV